MRHVTATEFKAKCLGLIDEVNTSGVSVTITKRGKPVATLEPMKQAKRKTTRGILAGKIEVPEDIVHINFADEWEVVREREAAEAQAARKGRRRAS